MTALELHRQNAELELAPILRVIKYLGFNSNSLSEDDVGRILKLYPYFERDPELVVGKESICQETGLQPEQLEEILRAHRRAIPYLGSPGHPMVPRVAIRMIRAIANGGDPIDEAGKELFTLTEMSDRTGISLASLSKYVKEHADRIPFEMVGKMRKFPAEAAEVFQQIKEENLDRRGGRRAGDRRRKRPSVSRRLLGRLNDLEDQVDEALTVAKDLARTLRRLSKQVHRARLSVESQVAGPDEARSERPRRSGSGRPDTIVAACRRILEEADSPMRVAEITDRVIALGAEIKAKNPNVTVSSILSSYDDFRRVKRGYYELAS